MMKYQYLAVIFVIIMLPISLVFSAYLGAQLDTLDLQISYDTKLANSTYDAIKAFQLNTVNSSTSDNVNSKIRDIEAAANSFFTSIATNFNMAGYNSEILQNYVPALVFTLYDGFYIYSPFENTLDEETSNKLQGNPDSTYQDGDRIVGLKPYIYYSCRYINGNIDVVITYSLDNYVTIQGTDSSGKAINDAGYLLDEVEYNSGTGKVTYRGIEITSESLLKEYFGSNEYEYIKINGQKYYKRSDGTWFYVLNGRVVTDKLDVDSNNTAYLYYKEAKEFKDRIRGYGLDSLTSAHAVDSNGNKLTEVRDANDNVVYNFMSSNDKIFNFDKIEEPGSDFNNHRLAVIRYVIENNLTVALANYSNTGTVNYDFRMPKLAEEDWDKILNNISLISFLQGLSIGGKIYNGYAVINNNKNEEVVTEGSIYIVTDNTKTYHRVTHSGLDGMVGATTARGVFNIDFETKLYRGDSSSYYYTPHDALGCYTCYVAETNVEDISNIYEYLDGLSNKTLAKLYYTALGRERYGTYKVFRNGLEHKKQFQAE